MLLDELRMVSRVVNVVVFIYVNRRRCYDFVCVLGGDLGLRLVVLSFLLFNMY